MQRGGTFGHPCHIAMTIVKPTWQHTCQQTLLSLQLRILDLNEYFHKHTHSQPETFMQPLRTYQRYEHARDTPSFPLSTTNHTWFLTSHEVYNHIYVL